MFLGRTFEKGGVMRRCNVFQIKNKVHILQKLTSKIIN